MKKRILSAISCVLLTVILVQLAGHMVRPIKTDTDVRNIETFLSMPDNSFEVIFYGSSHVYWSMDTIELYNKYGVGAYNYGNDGQHLNTTLLFFKDSLKTQKPKVAVFETFRIMDLLQDTNLERESYYTKALDNSSYKMEYLRSCFGDSKERWLSYFVPLFGLHENWTSIDRRSLMRNSSEMDFTKTMGYLNIGDVTGPTPTVFTEPTSQEPLSQEVIALLDEMVETAEENNVQLVFYIAPFNGWFHYCDAVREYAEDHGFPFINMFEIYDELGIIEEEDFCDLYHMNARGAVKIADYLGKFLTEHYDLTDFRTVPGNLWEKAQT